MSGIISPQPTVRRSARERQQAVLHDCAQRFPGLAPLFTVKQKTNYSVTRNRAGLADLPPRFATLQHHLQFPQPPQAQAQSQSDNSSSSSNNNVAHHLQAQNVIHQAQTASFAAHATHTNNNDATSTGTVPVNPHAPPSQILLTIQPHAALTPQEIAMHMRLLQIGLFPRGSPEEVAARKARIEEHKKATERKKQLREARKKKMTANEAKDSLLNNVKSGRVEKQKSFEQTVTGKFLAKKGTVAQDEHEDEDKELWGY